MIKFEKEYVEQECCSCGVVFWITRDLNTNLQKTKHTFFCPNGHPQSYTKSTAQRLEEELEIKNKRISTLEHEILLANQPKRKRKNGR